VFTSWEEAVRLGIGENSQRTLSYLISPTGILYNFTIKGQLMNRKESNHVVQVRGLDVTSDYKDVALFYELYSKYTRVVQPCLNIFLEAISADTDKMK